MGKIFNVSGDCKPNLHYSILDLDFVLVCVANPDR